MLLSVALCICNGGLYLSEQFANIADQSRPPDELFARLEGDRAGSLFSLIGMKV